TCHNLLRNGHESFLNDLIQSALQQARDAREETRRGKGFSSAKLRTIFASQEISEMTTKERSQCKYALRKAEIRRQLKMSTRQTDNEGSGGRSSALPSRRV
ncbi:hypothetical protein PENTCL1PPCAC_19988, partial [Pristionchus entomophagus]